MRVEDINSLDSESGIIASLIHNPELSFYSEQLLPEHFTRKDNRYVYIAICNLAKRGVSTVDPYNIIEVLNAEESTRQFAGELSIDSLQELISMSDVLARRTPEEYKILVSNVIDAAFRREMYQKLSDCQRLCADRNAENIQEHVYSTIDEILTSYSSVDDILPYSDVVDDCWREIQSRQGTGFAGIPFKFPTLNEYVTIEDGELVIFAAEAKQGKSMFLLNCAVDLLKQDKAVLYLDSELSDMLFTKRILAHLSGVEYKRLEIGAYDVNEAAKIDAAREWLKTRKFTHLYIPMFDQQTIYTTVKKVAHTQGIDVLIVDYFKGQGTTDAFASYAELGAFTDCIKNKICGDMKIAGIGAAQATSTGKLADSVKIVRNASTICMITDKTEEEIEADGQECGNKKLRVVFNRNGMQHASSEYIDMLFDGNHILYKEAKQHIPTSPY